MPIDFEKGKNYKFPYKDFFNLFADIQIFSDLKFQKKYFSSWEDKLRFIDNKKPETIIITNIMHSNELFKLPVDINFSSYYICQFHIKNLDDILKDNEDKIMNIRFKNNFMPLKYIYWTPVEDKPIYKYKTPIKPILLVPFLAAPYQALIIDGNHRLSYYKKYKPHSGVKVCELSVNYLIQKNMFPTEFDKYLYILLNELVSIANQRVTYGFTDDTLFNSSYIVCGNWNGIC